MKLKLENRAIAGSTVDGVIRYTIPFDTSKCTHLDNIQFMINQNLKIPTSIR